RKETRGIDPVRLIGGPSANYHPGALTPNRCFFASKKKYPDAEIQVEGESIEKKGEEPVVEVIDEGDDK
ncbi:hypothetical protein AKJ41_00880, partial [candidate division MSBL1 archaeon SCGC-AAA259O05]